MLEPDIVRLVGLSVAVSPVALTVAARLTRPLNPPVGVMLIIDCWLPPRLVMVTNVGLAIIEKSGVVTTSVMTAVVWASPPFVPVTVTV